MAFQKEFQLLGRPSPPHMTTREPPSSKKSVGFMVIRKPISLVFGCEEYCLICPAVSWYCQEPIQDSHGVSNGLWSARCSKKPVTGRAASVRIKLPSWPGPHHCGISPKVTHWFQILTPPYEPFRL